MRQSNAVLIVTADTIAGLGLKTFLIEHFSTPASYVSSWDEISIEELRGRQFQLVLCDKGARDTLPTHALESWSGRVVVFMRRGDSAPFEPCLCIDEPFDELHQAIADILPKPRHEKTNTALSPREIEVLKLLAQGYINKEIADRLSISVHTVISHRNNISEKLGIKTVPGLTVYATINGYISADTVL